ncbi:MAG TPA: right-handed parallel beta-helix repeat-containing protein [Gemmatimonadales bacterium]
MPTLRNVVTNGYSAPGDLDDHIVAAGDRRLLLVWVACRGTQSNSTLESDLDGALTKVHDETEVGGGALGLDRRIVLFALQDPTVGTHVMTWASDHETQGFVASSKDYIDAASPWEGLNDFEVGDGSSTSVDIGAVEADSLLTDGVSHRSTLATGNMAPGADQTEIAEDDENGTNVHLAVSTQSGADAGVMSYTMPASDSFAHIAVEILHDGGFTATGAVAYPMATVSGTGVQTHTGTGAVAYPMAIVAGAAVHGNPPTVAEHPPIIRATPPTAFSPFGARMLGVGTVAYPMATVVGAGVMLPSGTGAVSYPMATVAGVGVMVPSGTGAVAYPMVTVAGTGTAGLGAGTGAVTYPMVTVSGTGTTSSNPPTVAEHPRVIRPNSQPAFVPVLVVVANPPTVAEHPPVIRMPRPLTAGVVTVLNPPTVAEHPPVIRAPAFRVFDTTAAVSTTIVAVPMTATAELTPPAVRVTVPRSGRSVTLTAKTHEAVTVAGSGGEPVTLESTAAEDVTLTGPGLGSELQSTPDDPPAQSVFITAVPMTASAALLEPSVSSAVEVVAVPMTATAALNLPSVTGGSGSTIDISPGQNIQATINANPSGSVYRLLAGTHRLTNGGSDGTTGIFLKPGDEMFGELDTDGTWLTRLLGSVQLSSWVQDGPRWRHDNVTQSSWDPAHGSRLPWAPHGGPELLTVDGEQFLRVTSTSEVSSMTPFTDPTYGYTYSGSFYFDEGSNQVWIAVNPSGKTIELAYVNKAFGGGSNNIKIRDLEIAYFANRAQLGTVRLDGSSNLTFTGCWVHDSWGRLLHCGPNGYIANNRLSHSGQMGLGLIGNGTVFEYNEVDHNNLQGYNDGWEGGGSKIALRGNFTLRGNYFHHNHGRGIWADIDNWNMIFEYNYCLENWSVGIADELNLPTATNVMTFIRYNVSRLNGWGFAVYIWGSQIQIQNARRHKVYENFAETGSGGRDAITVVQQVRSGPSGGGYPSENNEFYDNTVYFPTSNSGQQGIGAGPRFVDGFDAQHPSVNNFHDNDYFGPSGFTTQNHWKGTNPDTGVGDDINYATWLSQGRGSGSTVTNGAPVRRLTLSGTATSADEGEVRSGGLVLTLTWEDRTDFWNPRIGTDPVVTQEFIDNAFSGSLGEFAEVVANMTITDFNRVDHRVLNITFPATASYDIAASELVSLTIPASSCVRWADLENAGSFTIGTV